MIVPEDRPSKGDCLQVLMNQQSNHKWTSKRTIKNSNTRKRLIKSFLLKIRHQLHMLTITLYSRSPSVLLQSDFDNCCLSLKIMYQCNQLTPLLSQLQSSSTSTKTSTFPKNTTLISKL